MSDWMKSQSDGWWGINRPRMTDSAIDQWSWNAGRKANQDFWASGSGSSRSSSSSSGSAAEGIGQLLGYCIIGSFFGYLIYGADAIFAAWVGGLLAGVAGFAYGGVAGDCMDLTILQFLHGSWPSQRVSRR